MTLESKLLSLGLSEKEVAVYLAMLNLGPATAQDIAIRAGINRATTYVMIDALIDKAMASQINKEKKTLFQSEDPIQLLRILEKQKDSMDELMGVARQVIPNLQELFNLNRGKLNVRLIEGRESLRILQNDISRTKSKSFDQITNLTLALEKFPEHDKDHRQPYYKENFKIRSLLTYDTKQTAPHLPFLNTENRRLISQEKFPMNGELVIYDDKIAISQFKDKIFVIMIEDKELAEMFRSIFSLAWLASEKFQLSESE